MPSLVPKSAKGADLPRECFDPPGNEEELSPQWLLAASIIQLPATVREVHVVARRTPGRVGRNCRERQKVDTTPTQ